MVAVTSSYIADLQQALVDELKRAMGVDAAEDYPDPTYLRLKTTETGNPVQPIQYNTEQLPAARIAFYTSRPTEDAIGGVTEYYRQDLFMVFITARFSGAAMSLTPGFTHDDLLIASTASIHELLQRAMHVLRELVPSITDTNWNWSTSNHLIGRFSAYLDYESQDEIIGKAWFEYIMESARTYD